MKKLFTILFLFAAFISSAQRSMFVGQNNYVVPEIPATLITTDLLLYLDANNTASYPGSGNGNTFYDLSANLNHGTLSTSAIANTASTPKKFTFNGSLGTIVSFDPLNLM